MPIELAIVSANRIEALSREKTVFFFPVGPLEDHGPHLPIGLDLEEASHLSFCAAQRLEEELPGWTGVVMPPAPLGIDSNTTKLAMTVRPHVLRDWLVDSCKALSKSGFCHFVCFSGHLGPKQLTAIEEAGKLIRRGNLLRGGFILPLLSKKSPPMLLSASSALVNWKDVFDSPFRPDPKEHGGARDTSIALAVAKDLVDPNFETLPALEPEPSRWLRGFKHKMSRISGYWGNPSEGKSERGEGILSEDLQKIFSKLKIVWEGGRPKSYFRTWYSVLPSNKSFFKAWILAAVICALMVGTLYFMIPSM